MALFAIELRSNQSFSARVAIPKSALYTDFWKTAVLEQSERCDGMVDQDMQSCPKDLSPGRVIASTMEAPLLRSTSHTAQGYYAKYDTALLLTQVMFCKKFRG